MKYVKMSLRSLLLWVAFAAVVAAALAQPSLLWSRLLFTLASALIAWSIVGAFSMRGSRRTFWIGTATLALGYFLILTSQPASNYGNRASIFPRLLITQQLLDLAADALGHNVRSQFADFYLWEEAVFTPSNGVMAPTGGFGGGGMGGGMPGGAMGGGGGFFDVDESSGAIGEPSGDAGSAMGSPGGADPFGTSGGAMGGPGGASPAGTPAAAPIITRPYAAYNHFLISGHFAFLILVALSGGWLAQTFFKSDEAATA